MNGAAARFARAANERDEGARNTRALKTRRGVHVNSRPVRRGRCKLCSRRTSPPPSKRRGPAARSCFSPGGIKLFSVCMRLISRSGITLQRHELQHRRRAWVSAVAPAGLHRGSARRDSFSRRVHAGQASSTQVSARRVEGGCDVAQLALARVVFASAAIDQQVAFSKVDVREDIRDTTAGQQKQQKRDEHIGAAALHCAVCVRVCADSGCGALPQAQHLGAATNNRTSV